MRDLPLVSPSEKTFSKRTKFIQERIASRGEFLFALCGLLGETEVFAQATNRGDDVEEMMEGRFGGWVFEPWYCGPGFLCEKSVLARGDGLEDLDGLRMVMGWR